MANENVANEKEQKEMEDVAKQLKQCMKGTGANDEMIIQLILKYSNNQRQMIKTKYQTLYKQYLIEDLKSNLNGEFQEVIIALLEETSVYEASFMNLAISRIGDDEDLICQLLCTKDAKELENLKSAYRRVYKRNLETDILSNKNGNNNGLYYSLASGNRKDNNGYDIATCKKDAKALFEACQGKLNEKVFIDILSNISFPQLYSTFACFSEIAKESIESVIKKNTIGNLQKTCLTMIKSVNNKPGYFAEILNEAMARLGTDDKTIIRILVTRSEIDLQNIKQEYKLIYRQSLREAVSKETSGHYEKCLLALIGKD